MMAIRYQVLAFPMDNLAQPQQFPEHRLPGFRQRLNEKPLGVAFSGGGTRSACCTLGQLKALHDTGVMKRVGYLSAVSGGSWASVPYGFLPAHQLPQFWGAILPPSQLRERDIQAVPERSFQYCLVNAGVVTRLLGAALQGRGDESYAEVIGRIFLAPFGLHQPKMAFSYDLHSVAEACDANANLSPDQFQRLRDGVPYLLVGATLLNGDGIGRTQRYHVEYTPYYSGVRVSHRDRDGIGDDEHFGGGYLSSYGYDCAGPYRVVSGEGTLTMTVKRSPRTLFDWTNEKAFSLSDIMASSGAAPQQLTNALGLGALGFPEFYHLPVQVPDGVQRLAEEYAHSDGGHMENLGIMPLLARGVTRLLVFINTKCPYIPGDDIESTNINKSLKALFVPLRDNLGLGQFRDNLVFEQGESKLNELRALFDARVQRTPFASVAHKGLFATQTLVTRDNPVYGIAGGREVTITWVYNQRSQAWENALADERLAQEIRQQGQDDWDPYGLDNFPHFETFMENAAVIDMTPVQTHLLASLARYVAKRAITDSWGEVED
ncbi:patatin-like phospholipase family protein [Ferrimonas kyonanensis]|uniref:patatin-like phospholipase family protein n=1 Tax=Ferrimonas kyonanensis TaxID=364763 RepID=UPI0012EB85FD|nr:patatin-like phospholipase family protein [Ferrimonas kyonanensis]